MKQTHETKRVREQAENGIEAQVMSPAISVRVVLQRYEPGRGEFGRRYREVKGSSIRLRFRTAGDLTEFTRRLRDLVEKAVTG